MNVMLEEADVVVGNYNHLFDPRTRPLLSSILDDQTFVIVDEAHRLEERVRDPSPTGLASRPSCERETTATT